MIIGIGGLSRSGKTKVAKKIRTELQKQGQNVLLLHQDHFSFPEIKIPKIKDRADYEHPDSIDWNRYLAAIQEGIKAQQTIISEGLFAFANQQLNQLYDRQIFVSIDQATFMQRKANDTRWGPLPPPWYLQHIWDAHQIHGQCPLPSPLQINGTKPLIINEIIDYIYKK